MSFPSPLPLTAFEEYMLRDDRPKYPMSIIAQSQVLRATGSPGDDGGPGNSRRAPSSAASQGLQDSQRRTGMDRVGRSSCLSCMDRRPGRRPLALDAADRPVRGTGIEVLGHGGFATECASASTAPCCLRRQGNDSIPGRLCAKLRPYLGRKAVPDRAFAQRSSCVARAREFRPDRTEVSADVARSTYGSLPRAKVLHAAAGSPIGTNRGNGRRAAGRLPGYQVGQLGSGGGKEAFGGRCGCQCDRKRLALARLLFGGG